VLEALLPVLQVGSFEAETALHVRNKSEIHLVSPACDTRNSLILLVPLDGIEPQTRGFADRKVGQATILNGGTTIVVTHGLSVTPDTCFLTPDTLGGLGTYAGFSVTTYGATTFTIESSRAVGENTEIFYDVFSRVNSLLC